MIIDVLTRTVKCDGPKCGKSVTFTNQEAPQALADNPWLSQIRAVTRSTPNPNTKYPELHYCNDVCMVEHITAGGMNPPEPQAPQLITDANEGAIRQAAEAQARAVAATKALKDGSGVTLS